MSPAPLAISALLILLVAAGAHLTLTALFPKRRGDTPYCRKCKYNLTGIDLVAIHARCPECGAKLAGRGVLFGERFVRPGRLAIGNILILVGFAPLAISGVDALRRVRWYELKPTALVLLDAQSNNAMTAIKGLDELSRRLSTGDLQDEHKSRLAEICLGHQADPQFHIVIAPRAIDVLGQMYEGKALGKDHTDEFLHNMVSFRLLARTVVVKEQPFPLAIPCQLRTPSRMPSVGISFEYDALGSSLAPSPPSHLGLGSGIRSYDNVRSFLTLNEAGHHELTCKGTITVYDRTIVKTASVSVEVLPEEPQDYIQLRRSPELDTAVARALKVERIDANASYFGLFLQAEVVVNEKLPVSLAFDVVGEYEGRQIEFGQCTVPRDETPTARWLRAPEPWTSPDRMTIIFTPSAEAAKRTLDLYEIWDGKLRLENIEVHYPR